MGATLRRSGVMVCALQISRVQGRGRTFGRAWTLLGCRGRCAFSWLWDSTTLIRRATPKSRCRRSSARDGLPTTPTANASGSAPLDVEVVRRPPNAEVLRGIYEPFKPHILHFIGHGDLTPGDEPRLRFDLSIAPPSKWGWTRQEIAAFLGNTDWKPRLVFLNACRSGASPTDTDNPEHCRSIADVFLVKGVRAVVAMQGDIRGPQAEGLAEVFYTRLAAGDPVDVALASARFVVSAAEKEGYKKRDWALPVLSLCCLPKDALPMMPRLVPPEAERVEKNSEFAGVSTFVDCHDERRRVFRAFHPPPRPDPDPLKHRLIVAGPEGVGKTSLRAHLHGGGGPAKASGLLD